MEFVVSVHNRQFPGDEDNDHPHDMLRPVCGGGVRRWCCVRTPHPAGPRYRIPYGSHHSSKQLVSASEDKTIRGWDLASRQTLRVIHGETGPADFGKIGAMAVAPDGTLLAAVRPVAPDESPVIRLFDFASGTQIGLLEGHEGAIRSLAFSSDGRH